MNKGTTIEPVKQRKISAFEAKWGESASSIGAREGVSPEAIHMRVKKFGTPWQRRVKPTACEMIYGKTVHSIALDLGLHYITVLTRLRKHGSPYVTQRKQTSNAEHDLSWLNEPYASVKLKGWLMPEHPDYQSWRYKHALKFLGDEQ